MGYLCSFFNNENGAQSQYKLLYLQEDQWNLMEQMVKVFGPLQIATTALHETEVVLIH